MKDPNTEVLIQIRDEIRATRTELSERIDQTNTRLDQANARLDRVERRQTESEIRLATELVAVVGAVNQLREAILEDRELRSTVLGHERRITALEARSST